jgi:hypothetical protein
LLSRTLGSRLRQAVAATNLIADIAPAALAMGRKQLEAALTPPDEGADVSDDATGGKAPVTRFNGRLSPHRVIEAIPFAMDDVRKIRHAFEGVTVNDVFSRQRGAVRRYLDSKGNCLTPRVSACADDDAGSVKTPKRAPDWTAR